MVGGDWRLAVGGDWRLAVGGDWRLAVGDWRLVVVGGDWQRLVIGDWWLMAVGSAHDKPTSTWRSPIAGKSGGRPKCPMTGAMSVDRPGPATHQNDNQRLPTAHQSANSQTWD